MYQSFHCENVVETVSYLLPLFKGSSIKQIWRPPKVYISNPDLLEGDFWHLAGSAGSLCTTPKTTRLLLKFFQLAGEVLPLLYEGHEFAVINVTALADALDEDRSTWLIGRNDSRVSVQKFVFHNLFITSTLFKIPQNNSVDLFALERNGDPNQEFKACVEANKLTGLKFDLVWDSESEGV